MLLADLQQQVAQVEVVERLDRLLDEGLLGRLQLLLVGRFDAGIHLPRPGLHVRLVDRTDQSRHQVIDALAAGVLADVVVLLGRHLGGEAVQLAGQRRDGVRVDSRQTPTASTMTSRVFGGGGNGVPSGLLPAGVTFASSSRDAIRTPRPFICSK